MRIHLASILHIEHYRSTLYCRTQTFSKYLGNLLSHNLLIGLDVVATFQVANIFLVNEDILVKKNMEGKHVN